MKKAELERKRELLAKITGSLPDTPTTHLELLLASYAAGDNHRREVADNIVAKYRQMLRTTGPNYDGPLFADLMTALEAAESYGKTAKQQG